MNSVAKHNGFSLIELLVALGIIAALVGLAIPAINAMQKSYDSTGAESMLSAALATARTLAITNHKYAGIRFQKAWSDSNDILKAHQYMIFIVDDEDETTLGDRFRAIEGYKPIKLPENMGVMDLKLYNSVINSNGQINEDWQLTDTTAFSIIFSPSGKLVTHDVQTRNKDNVTSGTDSNDTVFNTWDKITAAVNPAGQFLQDDNSYPGLGKEQSRNKCIIYDCEKFSKLDKDKRYNDYLKDLKFIYINAYTGGIIK